MVEAVASDGPIDEAGTFVWFADEPHHELAWYEIEATGYAT